MISINKENGQITEEYLPEQRSHLYGITAIYPYCPSGESPHCVLAHLFLCGGLPLLFCKNIQGFVHNGVKVSEPDTRIYIDSSVFQTMPFWDWQVLQIAVL